MGAAISGGVVLWPRALVGVPERPVEDRVGVGIREACTVTRLLGDRGGVAEGRAAEFEADEGPFA